MNKLTNVAFVDNSGSRYGQVIHVYANNKKHVAYSLVLVAIKRVIPNNLKKLKLLNIVQDAETKLQNIMDARSQIS